MNAEMVCQMQNLMGAFSRYTYLEQYEKINTLFSDREDVTLNLFDENLSITGRDQLFHHFFSKRACLQKQGYEREIILYNTPCFKADPDEIRGNWDAFIFRLRGAAGDDIAVEPSFGRLDCDFVMENGRLKIRRMDRYQLMNWEDWKCSFHQGDQMRGEAEEIDFFEVDHINCPDPDDFVNIEKLISRFTHTNRLGAEALFADSDHTELFIDYLMDRPACTLTEVQDALQRLQKMEEDNGRQPICVPYVAGPVITVARDGCHATGHFLDMSFCTEGPGWCLTVEEAVMRRRIGLLDTTFVKQGGTWKIEKYHYTTREVFAPVGRHLRGTDWKPAVEETGNTACAEDIFEIQSIMLHWTERLKTGRLMEFPDLFMSENKEEITEWLSYDPKRKCVGYDAIMKDLYRMDHNYETKNKYHASIVHCAMTPLIEVSEDGTMARGDWMDLCYTDTSQITGDYTLPIRAMMNACKYQHIFRKEQGKWKMLHFSWGAWAAMDQITADPTTWSGWVNHPEIPWPMPFDRYQL